VTVPGHLRWHVDAGGVQERGGEVGQHRQAVDDGAGPDPPRPADGQRLARPGVVEVRFGPWERPSVVGGDHDERVVCQASLVEQSEGFPEFAVEALHLRQIVHDVHSDLRRIGQIGRDIDGPGIDAGECAELRVIWPVRVGGAEPEAERRILLLALEETLERAAVMRSTPRRPRRGSPVRAAGLRRSGSCRRCPGHEQPGRHGQRRAGVEVVDQPRGGVRVEARPYAGQHGEVRAGDGSEQLEAGDAFLPPSGTVRLRWERRVAAAVVVLGW
jgi:hypothetical protein